MKVLKVENGIQKEVNYPRIDKTPVIGLNKNITYYELRENKPSFDPDTQYLKFLDYTLTEEKGVDFTHLKIADKNYEVKDIITEKTLDEKVNDLEEIIIILSKEEKDRTVQDKAKIEEIKNKIETKTLRNGNN